MPAGNDFGACCKPCLKSSYFGLTPKSERCRGDRIGGVPVGQCRAVAAGIDAARTGDVLRMRIPPGSATMFGMSGGRTESSRPPTMAEASGWACLRIGRRHVREIRERLKSGVTAS